MNRYLLAVSAVPGHVMPMVRIGQHLAGRGHQVEILTGARFAGQVESAGLRFLALPPGGVIDDQPSAVLLDRPPVPQVVRRWQRGRAEMRSLFIAPMAAQFRTLTAALADAAAPGAAQVDAILVDVGFTGVLPLLLAPAPRPPVIVCNMTPLMLSSTDTAPFGTARQPEAGVDYREMNWVVHHLLFGGVQAHASRVLRRLGGGSIPVFLPDWPRLADRMLQLSVPALEYPRTDLPDSVIFAGPVLPAPAPAATLPEWWPDLAAARAVVHVTQGTWDNADLDRLIGPAMRGLAHDDVLVVVSTGGRPVGAVPGPVAANVRIAEFLPYDLLLPLVDVMVTNGGYSGVQHALSCGVPLIVAGDTADKAEVAARLSYNRCGIDLHSGRPAPGAVAAAVREILGDAEYRRQAGRLGRDIAATNSLDTTVDVVTAFGRRQLPLALLVVVVASGVDLGPSVRVPGPPFLQSLLLRLSHRLSGRLALDVDPAHDRDPVDRDHRASGRAGARVRVVEGAHDADAGHPHSGVLGHDDLAAAHDRDDVDSHLALGELGFAQVDLAAAHEAERVEVLGYHPVALAAEPAEDGDRGVRGGLAAEAGRVDAGRGGGNRRVAGAAFWQVVGNRLELGVGLGRVHGVEALVEFVHGQPAVTRGFAQHFGGALSVGVGGAQVPRFGDGRRAHISQA
jgi:UDP:flavonoid glycosyltransferase YjiC (YdhE family)